MSKLPLFRIERFVPESAPGRRRVKPFLRVSTVEGGCPLEGCNCSPGYWLSVSDGRAGLLVRFQSKRAMISAMRWGSDVTGVRR